MSDEIVLVGNGDIYLSAEMRDKLLARFPNPPGADDSLPAGVGLPPGYRVIVLTDDELRLKAKEATLRPLERPSQRYDSPDRRVPVARSVVGMHPGAMTREAIRRRRQMARRAAKAREPADA